MGKEREIRTKGVHVDFETDRDAEGFRLLSIFLESPQFAKIFGAPVIPMYKQGELSHGTKSKIQECIVQHSLF